MRKSVEYRESGGAARAPASKSSMQRAIACAALAEGESILRSPSRSADCLAALSVAEGLGAVVEDRDGLVSISGIGFGKASHKRSGGSSEILSLSCGESGLCLRMFSPIAALFDRPIELAAMGSLRLRPVGMMSEPLRQLGASCDTASGVPPVMVRGPLRGGRATVDGRQSSQFLTGLLVALPLARTDSEIEVDDLASRGYVDLTIDVIRRFGVAVLRDHAYRNFSIAER